MVLLKTDSLLQRVSCAGRWFQLRGRELPDRRYADNPGTGPAAPSPALVRSRVAGLCGLGSLLADLVSAGVRTEATARRTCSGPDPYTTKWWTAHV